MSICDSRCMYRVMERSNTAGQYLSSSRNILHQLTPCIAGIELGCRFECTTYRARCVVDMETWKEALSDGLLHNLEHR